MTDLDTDDGEELFDEVGWEISRAQNQKAGALSMGDQTKSSTPRRKEEEKLSHMFLNSAKWSDLN